MTFSYNVQRLLLCCCMNVDAAHPGRMEHTKVLALHPEFSCPVTQAYVGHHIQTPWDDQGSHEFDFLIF